MMTEDLERALERLADPREGDERLRLAIRARLDDRVEAGNRRRRRPALGIRWASAGAVAAAIGAALVLLGWPAGSTGPSAAGAAILRHALQAITLPADAIVHIKETGVDNGRPVSVEWWQRTSPPYTLRMIKGLVGQELETADTATTSFRYDTATNTIVQTPASSPPALVDPIEGVRAQLAHGDARVAGTSTIDGTKVYEIDLPNGVVAYFDTTNYQPMYVDNDQRDGGVVRTRVGIYQELPMTPGNTKLLSITAAHPDARVQTDARARVSK